MTKLHALAQLGQAVWYDYIRRSFLTSGELKGLVEAGVRGVTSNPSIFEKAIAGSADYDADLERLVREQRTADEIYEALVLEDIRHAADILRPVYEETDGADGFVSLEVSPTLAHDTEGTVAEARRLFQALESPNAMIKVPATPAGVPAIEALIAEGVNVNVTLIFSLSQYESVAEAYLRGLAKRKAGGGELRGIASVASFFVSRVDTAVDALLEEAGGEELRGKIAVDNAKVAYARFQELFSGARWEALAEAGARVQRPLWASTGTKNPLYSDTLYVDELIGPHTVNTLPPATLQAFLDHGTVEATIGADLEGARARIGKLPGLGIDLGAVTQKLQDDGVDAFAQAFTALMESIREKREHLRARWTPMAVALGSYRERVDRGLEAVREQNLMGRIWAHDHTVWKSDPAEITNRLGWLTIAEVMAENLAAIRKLVADVREAGYTQVLLLGMGGSSLAPEVFRKTFGVADGCPNLSVLDSTDPGAVRARVAGCDPARTMFVVSTKSGGTVETLSLFKAFYNRALEAVGEESAGDHFCAITDPGSSLADLAARHRFRTTFLNDPNIGGRYSALSYFGLLPAALVGVDIGRILDRALVAADNCESCNCPVAGDNHGAQLGVILGELARAGRDKLTLVPSPSIASFADWVEQLIAESTGKQGKGIVPVVGETLGSAQDYGDDRLFVHLRLEGDDSADTQLRALEEAGHPVVCLHLSDPYDLGAQFFLWEMGVAVAGARLGIHPFNQPDVESAKGRAREMLSAYRERGALPQLEPAFEEAGITVYGDVTERELGPALAAFLGGAEQGAYVALQAFVDPTAETERALQELRLVLRERTRMAVTVGFGPRFLHSTGQLHKGDAGKGLFLQFTADAEKDLPIPDEAGRPASSVTFGTLIAAQALGDRQALVDKGRRVLRFHLGSDATGRLRRLATALG